MPCWFREQPLGAAAVAARQGLLAGLLRAAAKGNRLEKPLGQSTRTGLLMTNMVVVVVSFSVTQCRGAVKLAEGAACD